MTAAGRPAAILAVDVVGRSRLMGEDGAGGVLALCPRQMSFPTDRGSDREMQSRRGRPLSALGFPIERFGRACLR